MELDMRHYIDRQPDALRETIGRRAETSALFAELWGKTGADRLYLVGSGTSGNAARAAAPFLQEVLDTEVTAVSPTSLPTMLKGKPFFLLVSQGGQSTNTVRAVEQTAAYPRMALTGETECRINTICPHAVLVCGHEEAGPKTMGYTATILTLYLMAMDAALAAGRIEKEAYNTYLRKLENTAGRMSENIAMAWQWVREAERSLIRAKSWAAAGTGISRFVAEEAALKLMETLLRPGAGFEYEEYLHGPAMMLNDETGGMYLLPPKSSPDRQRMEALADIHVTFGSPVVTIGAGEHAERKDFRLTFAAEEDAFLAPFWQILPSQVMGAALPAVLGTEGKGHEIFQRIDKAVGVKCKDKT